MDSISELPTRSSLQLTDEIPISNKGRGSEPEKTTLQSVKNLIGGGGAGGSAQIYIGGFDDPSGEVVPDDVDSPALYYKDQIAPPIVWLWSTGDQQWFNILS